MIVHYACPACGGLCCILPRENDRKVPHYATYAHSCPDCDDGTYGVRSEPEPAPKPVRTAEEERADALAWLWDVGTSPAMSADEMVTFHWIARALHGGEHVGAAAKREKP